MKNLEKLNTLSDENQIDLESLNNFLLKKGDSELDFSLQVKEYKKIDNSSDRIHDYYLEKSTKDIPKDLFNNYSFCDKRINRYPGNLRDVPENLKDYKLCEKAISKNGGALKYVPEHLKDYNFCDKAVSNNSVALRYVPEELKDYKLCDKAVSKYSPTLEYVPEYLKDYKICDKAVSDNAISLEFVPENVQDYKLCDKAISVYGYLLQYVRLNLRDYKLCKKACINSADAIYHTPKNYILQLIKDFPDAKEELEKFLIKEHISKEVRKLLKEYYLK